MTQQKKREKHPPHVDVGRAVEEVVVGLILGLNGSTAAIKSLLNLTMGIIQLSGIIWRCKSNNYRSCLIGHSVKIEYCIPKEGIQKHAVIHGSVKIGVSSNHVFKSYFNGRNLLIQSSNGGISIFCGDS